jgi:hypothetical protein
MEHAVSTTAATLDADTRWLINPRWESDPDIAHGITTRKFGAKEAGNTSRLVTIRRDLEMPDAVSATMEQVHGDTVAWIGAEDLDRAEEQRLRVPATDAMVTDQRGVLLHLRVADCVPILALDRRNGLAGVAHAGWRGTVKRIAEAFVRTMAEHGADLDHLEVWLGPSICARCFEVGPDVLAQFTAVNRWWPAIDLRLRRVDLALINRMQMARAGVPPDHVVTSPLCTRCRVDMLHSHRAEPTNEGRLVGSIGMRTAP